VVEVVKSSLVECRCIEIANHLGNTLATISDRKTATGASGTPATHFNAITQTANDYYPFGMVMPGRNYNNGTTKDYRYGFNGKENDNEVKGEGNQQDYGMRIYDPRLGRFLSEDPITEEYPELTPYQFAGNMPIAFIDLDGLEPAKPGTPAEGDTKTVNTPGNTFGVYAQGPSSTTYYYHAGGLTVASGLSVSFIDMNPKTRDKNATVTKPGWYTSEEYTKILSSTRASIALANQLGYISPAGKPNAEIRADHNGVSDLDKFTKEGLSINATNHLVAAAKKSASSINSYVSGRAELSLFNVEDLIGVIFIGKQLLKAAANVVSKQITKINSKFINLASPARTRHIIAGDATGGGHAWFGSLKSFSNGLLRRKSMFPLHWSNKKIMHAISDVAVNNPWIQQTGKAGAAFTKSGAPVRYTVIGYYEGVKIKVVTTATDIITAFKIK
jgi:RHS repeat-associated protein